LARRVKMAVASPAAPAPTTATSKSWGGGDTVGWVEGKGRRAEGKGQRIGPFGRRERL
jgi:hypothetical protein